MAISPAQDVLRFGLFELDLAAGLLSRQGTRIRLPQQPMQLLALLLERPGEILTREELRSRLWPSDVFVDFDHGLNKSIQKLREVLGDSASSPRYIETIPRVGYRFIAPVSNGHQALPAPTPAEPPPARGESIPAPRAMQPQRRWWGLALAAVVVCLLAAAYLSSRKQPSVARFTRLTDFIDSASSPVLSPDGRILAFLRGDISFMSDDAIYVKMLPDGEPRLLTADGHFKYGLAFSPDGSQLAYTVIQDRSFVTYTVSVLGGKPHVFLNNAAGLTWLDAEHLLFSRIRSGLHLGVVTAGVTGDHLREIYFPPHERAMAHDSWASPDHTTALVAEMNGEGEWDQCRTISLERVSPPRLVGPQGACTAAGWSPDGAWMYFIVSVDGQSHLWRQRSPFGEPQQITFGPTEEEGLAIERDGKAIVTGMGLYESSLWIHDERGDRSLSSEGEIVNGFSAPVFAANDSLLYYLTQAHATDAGPELWRMSLATGSSEPVLPGIRMAAFDISPDGNQLLYSSVTRDGSYQLWVSPIDRSAPARQIGNGNERWPHFGPAGEIIYLAVEANDNYLERMTPDGRGRAKVIAYPIHEMQSISPGRTWLAAVVDYPEGAGSAPWSMAIPLKGGEPRRLCKTYCYALWASSGKFLYIPVEAATHSTTGRSLAIPLGPGESLPALPAQGIPPQADASLLRGAQTVERSNFIGGKDPAHYAYVNTAVHRNIYRVALP
jgi:DNA-binding winged helix-turn-helix (wHTH) protein/Tol biopolymer transport system component